MTREIEVCSNNEWLFVYGPLSGLGLEADRDLGDEWHAEVCRRLESELGVDAVASRGQRSMCHGWNGANTFVRKDSGIGTFDDFTDAEWSQAINIARAVAADIATDNETPGDRKGYDWAVAEQGYQGTYDQWLAMPEDERQEYENGAAGIPTQE